MRRTLKKAMSLVLTAALCVTAVIAGVFPASAAANYTAAELAKSGKIKIQGRYALSGSDGSLLLENSASGIEFIADCSGDVSVTLKSTRMSYASDAAAKGGIYFTVLVDGVPQHFNERIPADSSANNWTSNSTNYPYVLTAKDDVKTFTLAEGLEQGEHRFEIYCQSQAKYGAYAVQSVTLDGEIKAAPAENDLYIEFVGDSITAGHGNIANGGTSDENTLYTDATRGWAYLTAKNLGADWSVIAQSGIAATDGINWARNPDAPVKDWPSIGDVYPKLRFYSDQNTNYDFARQPDVIVVGLGTNDVWLESDEAYKDYDIKEGFKDTLTMLRGYNPNAAIIWIYGMLTDGANDRILSAVEELGGEEAGLYTLKLQQDKSGGSGHPGLAVQETYAETVSEYIESVLAGSPVQPEVPEKEIWDGSKPTEKPAYEGEGTEASPYMITNGAELYWAISNSNAGVYFKLANDIYLNDFTVEIVNTNGSDVPVLTVGGSSVRTDSTGAVIDDSGLNQWYINEGSGTVFQGILDGDYHVIRGLFTDTLKSHDSSVENFGAGLIPKARNAQIYNLGIEDSYIRVDTEAGKKGYSVGVFCGSLNGNNYNAVIKNCYIGSSVYAYGNVVGGFIANGGSQNGIVFENLYSLATYANPEGANGNRLGAIGGGMWNLANNNPTDAYADNTAVNVYANEKLFGNRAPFCTNAYGTVVGGNGPKVWDPSLNDGKGGNTNELIEEAAAIVIDESQMKGLDTVMELGEAFELRENDFPVLKGFENKQPSEPDPEPEDPELVRPEGEWDGSLDEELAGEGTAESPYLVTSAGELAYVIKNGGVENAYYRMTCDIYLNDGSKINKDTGMIEEGYLAVPWFSADDVKPFMGAEFDGGGHVVYGLYSSVAGSFTKLDTEKGVTALFPITRKDQPGTVTIKNIGLADSYLRSYNTAGGIVGYGGNKNSEGNNPVLNISGCFVEEDVTVSGYSVGGILGMGSTATNIDNCYSVAKLVNNGGRKGLAGNWWGNKDEGRTLSVRYCYSSVAINGNQITVSENNYANFESKGPDALASLEGFDGDIWYAVKDETKYPMLRVRGAAIGDVDENGIFEPALDLAAQRKTLLLGAAAGNGDSNGDGEFDIRDLISLKKKAAYITG